MTDVLRLHLPMLPVLLPALAAAVLLLLGDDPDRRRLQRTIGLAATSLVLLAAIALAARADGGELTVYRLGDWPAPFGIVLVVDRLAALMLVLTGCIALPALLHGCDGTDREGRHFHALFQFQLMGLNGAFLTGDLFNLFVFFEVLLAASYALMLHGRGRERLRAGLHYVVLNLVASALFLVGVSLVYALTGTLNLADLALRLPRVEGPEAALLQSAGLILLVVFGFKAALLPLSLWLPATYAATSASVAALFAIMTKVGLYAIVRVHGVVYGADGGGPGGDAADATALAVHSLLLPIGLATSLFAAFGAIAAPTLARLIAWLTVVSAGTVLTALAIRGTAAAAAAIFYLAQSTLVIAGLFLLAALIAAQRGRLGGTLAPAPAVAQPQVLGILLLLGGATVAGLPPLPGFVGKLMLLQAADGHEWMMPIWAVVLAVGFLSLIGLARAGSTLFWNVRSASVPPSSSTGEAMPPLLDGAGTVASRVGPGAAGVDAAEGRAGAALLAATAAPLLLLVAMSVLAAPLQRFATATAAQIADRTGYARAVLGAGSGAATATTRRYPPASAPPPSDAAGSRR